MEQSCRRANTKVQFHVRYAKRYSQRSLTTVSVAGAFPGCYLSSCPPLPTDDVPRKLAALTHPPSGRMTCMIRFMHMFIIYLNNMKSLKCGLIYFLHWYWGRRRENVIIIKHRT